jgi:hypothetical protein
VVSGYHQAKYLNQDLTLAQSSTRRFELSEAVERLEQLELAAVFRLILRQALVSLTIRSVNIVLLVVRD